MWSQAPEKIRFCYDISKNHTTSQLLKKTTTDEYKALQKKRNGVEGLPSVLRRRYNVDTMPVRGLVRSKIWFSFKIGAINVKRVLKIAAEKATIQLAKGNICFCILKQSKTKKVLPLAA